MHVKTANTIIYCTQWQETVDFYKNGLGLAITTERDWFIEFRLNDYACLSIANAVRTSRQSCRGQGLIIAMEVADIKSTYRELEKVGLHPEAIRDHAWGARVFYLHDPEGNRLEFWSSKLPAQENNAVG